MGLKTFTILFSQIKKDLYLRNDEKYHNFLFLSDWNLFNTTDKKLVSLKDILLDDYALFVYKDNEEYKGIPTGQTYLDEDGEIIEYQTVTSNDHPGRLKYRIKNNNILLSSLRLAKTPALYFENQDISEYVFSNGFYIFSVNSNWNKKFILYILRTKKLKNILDNHIYRGIGISAYKKEDLLKIKIPLVQKSEQDQIVARIEPLEIKIKNLKSLLKQPQEIINQVFAREFTFNENLYNDFGKGMTAGTQIAKEKRIRVFKTIFGGFSRSNILRFSTRYHNPPTKILMNLIDTINTFKVKDILTAPIHRGATPGYDPDGNIPVVKTAHLKNGYIEISQEEFVNYDYYISSTRSQIKKGDILLASTGKVSLGKIDLLTYNIKLVADSHVSIIRINKNKYNPLFFTYFFRSILGYFQIERDYTGTTNQIELYPNDISNFLVPNISLKEQNIIVDEIKAELDKQEEIKKQIEIERNKIDEIIENAIK